MILLLPAAYSLLVLVLLPMPTGGAPTAPTLAGCNTSCGNLTFEYPFGIGQGCFRQPNFELTCLHGNHLQPPSLFLQGGTQVVDDIVVSSSDDNNVPSVSVSMSDTISVVPGVDVYNYTWTYPESFFPLYATVQITGCDFDVYFIQYNESMLLCNITCPNEIFTEGEAKKNCNGTGCCYFSFSTSFFDLQFVRHNKTESHSSNNSLWNSIQLSLYSADLGWSIVDQPSCSSALDKQTSYACVSTNSSCLNSSSTYFGYLCSCDSGFAGNPYISQGCSRDKGYNPFQQKANCSRSCGNITVPYPFGLEEGCFARKLFHLNCTEANSSTLRFDKYNQVTDIKIEEGVVLIKYDAGGGGDQEFMAIDGEPHLYDGSWDYSISVGWAVANLTCLEAKQNASGYACVSTNSTCVPVNSTSGYVGYRCNCTAGFHGNPYMLNGCIGINECQKPRICNGVCDNHCTAAYFGHYPVLIGICSFIFTVLIALLGMQVIIHRRSIKRQRLIRQRDEYFQQHGGQLLSDMMKIDCNLEFTLYRQEDIEVATN